MLNRFSSVVCLLATSVSAQIIVTTGKTGAVQPGSTGQETAIALYKKADTLRKEGKNEEALKVLNEAVWFDSSCGKCFGLRSGVHYNLGQYKEGISDGFTGEQRSTTPRDKAMSAYNKGLNMSRLGRSAEAISVFNDCIRHDETYGSCFYGKGKTLIELGVEKDALEPLEKAVELMPRYGPAWAYLAFARGGAGQAEESLEAGNKAVDLTPTDPRSYLARGYGHALNGKFEEALVDLARALELDPARPNAHLLRAQSLQRLGRHEEAAVEFELEPNKRAVNAVLHPETQFDSRLYNCGDDSTELPSLSGGSYFDRCKDRIIKSLENSSIAQPTKPQRKPLPNVRTVVPNRKK
jgi:tetratricopeptide (TPR) repeat protein